MNTRMRWFVIALVATNLGFLAGNVAAGQLPEGIKKPGGAELDPIEKVVCRHRKTLYEQGSRLEINGKDYICTRYNGWVLAPV